MSMEERFFALYRPEQGRLYRTAWAILGNEADAADALQEATIRAYRAFDQLKGGDVAFPAWMRRILVNTCTQILRKRMRVIPVEKPEDLGPHGSVETELPYDGDVWDAVRSLDERYRVVVVLRFLNDMQLDEIARVLDIPLGTVKSRLHAAMKLLRNHLNAVEARKEGRGVDAV
ncbi:RNA polymerase sigma-70 factor (ECF subfamily) [Symbiobacterium terraclitae]|uniref:RNA polymerase sigma-70 factor (ECF subfamily) n=2 Tax=Symbiobacterium terraclitae TaxID=557451 RepID=A0ABS4JYS5_9FIRM|nr:RNA polymerase sigma-70 factor (ECF subfamily) [Symbiobacterium terraclitae]